MKLQRAKSTPKQEQQFKLMLDSIEASVSHTLDSMRVEHGYDGWQLIVGTLNHLRRAAVASGEHELAKLLQSPLAYSFLRLVGNDAEQAIAGLSDALAHMDDKPLPAQNAPATTNVQ